MENSWERFLYQEHVHTAAQHPSTEMDGTDQNINSNSGLQLNQDLAEVDNVTSSLNHVYTAAQHPMINMDGTQNMQLYHQVDDVTSSSDHVNTAQHPMINMDGTQNMMYHQGLDVTSPDHVNTAALQLYAEVDHANTAAQHPMINMENINGLHQLAEVDNVDHMYTAAQHPMINDLQLYHQGLAEVDNDQYPSTTFDSGLQLYHQDQDLNITIPYYFEDNNVYPIFNNNNFFDQTSEFQNNNNNNMLLQSNSNFDLPNFLPSQMVDTQYSDNLPLLLPASTLPYSLVPLDNTFNYNQVSSYDQSSSVANSRAQSNSRRIQRPSAYVRWTEEEDEFLRDAVKEFGPHKWSLVATCVPNRTPMQCSTRWLTSLNQSIHKGRWTPEEDSVLKMSVEEFINLNLVGSDGCLRPIPWNKIASRIPHRTGIQCQARWTEALDPSVKKGKWTYEEDRILIEGVRRNDKCWIRIAELIEGRTQRQCRTRWLQMQVKQERLERQRLQRNQLMRLLTSPTETSPTDSL